MLRDAIDEYHDLLDDELAAESQHHLDAQLAHRGLLFGGRALCSVLRPRFISASQYRFLQRRAALVLSAFRTAHRAALADDAVLAQFRLTDWELELVRTDPGFRDSSPVSRLDAFFVGETGGLRFTEYNAESPAGGGYNDALTEMFYGLPVMREFLRRWDLRPLPARHNVLHAMVDAYAQWSGTRDLPRVAIADWSDVPTYSEFVLYRDYLARQGLPVSIVDPREVTYSGGKLSGPDGPIDLVYKRVLLSELVEREGVDTPILRAVRDRAVCMVNPAACKILHKKASLAVLSDERNAHLFDGAAREAVGAHIPWTRVVEPRRTVRDGAEVDLLEYIAANKDTLVLKPNDEYGGKGIVLGWEVDQEGWDAAVRTALAEPYIVQARVELPTEPYPSLVDGKLLVLDRMVDTAPYVAYGEYVDGCLSRLSTAALLNVTAGGGSQTPTLVAERR